MTTLTQLMTMHPIATMLVMWLVIMALYMIVLRMCQHQCDICGQRRLHNCQRESCKRVRELRKQPYTINLRPDQSKIDAMKREVRKQEERIIREEVPRRDPLLLYLSVVDLKREQQRIYIASQDAKYDFD